MTIAQAAYRFGSEDGTESTHGFLEALNTPISRDATNASTFFVRILIQATSTGLSNIDVQLQRSLNGGAFGNVTTTSTVIKAVTTAIFTDQANCTSRLGGTGTADTTNAGASHTGLCGGNNFDIITNGHGDVLYAVQQVPADIATGNTITFKVLAEGADLSGGYPVTPTINVTGAAATSLLYPQLPPSMMSLLAR